MAVEGLVNLSFFLTSEGRGINQFLILLIKGGREDLDPRIRVTLCVNRPILVVNKNNNVFTESAHWADSV